jgi:hypothetical protein
VIAVSFTSELIKSLPRGIVLYRARRRARSAFFASARRRSPSSLASSVSRRKMGSSASGSMPAARTSARRASWLRARRSAATAISRWTCRSRPRWSRGFCQAKLRGRKSWTATPARTSVGNETVRGST